MLVMLIACGIGNKATKELYSTSTMPGKILSKFNEENAWFLPQFFVSGSGFFSSVSNISCLVELADISRSHNCNKHSSLLVVVSIQFCSFRTRKSIGKHLSALFLLFCVRS
jgi:hypothetical protein